MTLVSEGTDPVSDPRKGRGITMTAGFEEPETSNAFILSCESTVDVPYAYCASRDIPVIFYSYFIDGQEYVDDMGRDPEALPGFYRKLAAGSLPSTSQINTIQYVEYFEPMLSQGHDLLHICLGTGMTKSYENACEAAQELRERYPERKLLVLDSLCSSSGYGLLVDGAADLRDRSGSLEEIAAWVEANRKNVHHQFYCTDLKYFKRSGRVSGATATVGAILGICPIMRLNDEGRIIAYDKVRGKNAALRTTVRTMEAHAVGGADYAGKCWVCHSDCPETAALLKDALEKHFPNIQGDVWVNDIGTIIASHCGPGTVAVFFFGDERAPG